MAVKGIQSAERVLTALETLAEHQPIGVGALARVLGADKSAVQRALVTLADAGWIRAVPGEPTRWELTSRVLVVANHVQLRSGLRQRVRPLLESLRDRTGETAVLAVADGQRVVIADVVESRHLVRTAPHIGMVVPTETSATGQALLAASDDAARTALLGGPTPPALAAQLAAIAERGWSLNADDVAEGATSVGVAIRDAAGMPVGAIAVSAVSSRMPPDDQQRLGELLVHQLGPVPS
ncbi:MAG: helix-turn-helix domain-containing protein [Acidimicrobiales bacterium]|nr:helix-turn-helix domain-containing protein [Acidimicrobiales bacterium]